MQNLYHLLVLLSVIIKIKKDKINENYIIYTSKSLQKQDGKEAYVEYPNGKKYKGNLIYVKGDGLYWEKDND